MLNKSSNVVRTETFEIENPEVHLETISSDVEIFESLDGIAYIEFHATSEEAIRQAEHAYVSANGSKISIRVGKRNRGLKYVFSFQAGGLNIILRLPKTSALDLKTVSGEVNVEVTLLNLDITTVSGDVQISQNPTTRCGIKTVSGDISAHTYSGCDYSLKSVSGDIAVHVASGLEIEVDGKSISGDMESEISLTADSDSTFGSADSVTITASTISGDFKLAKN